MGQNIRKKNTKTVGVPRVENYKKRNHFPTNFLDRMWWFIHGVTMTAIKLQ